MTMNDSNSDNQLLAVDDEKVFATHHYSSRVYEPEDSIILTLDQLVPSGFDPRKTVNPKYNEIKESIRTRGLDRSPDVTQHPGNMKWMICDGGNTRLRILKELYQEYFQLAENETHIPTKLQYEEKARQYYTIKCRIKIWKGMVDAIIGHLVENDMRGDMLFYDKAIATEKLVSNIEAELRESAGLVRYSILKLTKPLEPREHISNRQLSQLLSHLGWTIEFSTLARFRYAAERLFHLIPNPFLAGAGHNLVRDVSKLRQAYVTFLKPLSETKLDDADEIQIDVVAGESRFIVTPDIFNSLWEESLGKHNADHFDLGAVRGTLDRELSMYMGLEQFVIKMHIDAILQPDQPTTIELGKPPLSKSASRHTSSANQATLSASADIRINPVASAKKASTPVRNPMSTEATHKLRHLATQWNLHHMVKENSDDDNRLAIEIGTPDRLFSSVDSTSYEWMQLIFIASLATDFFAANIRRGFVEDMAPSDIMAGITDYLTEKAQP